jgi:hypothetical protein
MLSIIRSAALVGVEAVPVEIEVNTGEKGELGLWLVGLPDAAVKESEERVQSALQNSGRRLPETRTTINLAPGDLKKEGAIYDLPIALGIAASTGQLDRAFLRHYLIAGELGLSGATRPVRGGVAMAILARKLRAARRHPAVGRRPKKRPSWAASRRSRPTPSMGRYASSPARSRSRRCHRRRRRSPPRTDSRTSRR